MVSLLILFFFAQGICRAADIYTCTGVDGTTFSLAVTMQEPDAGLMKISFLDRNVIAGRVISASGEKYKFQDGVNDHDEIFWSKADMAWLEWEGTKARCQLKFPQPGR